jgi:hypothetical protein
MAVNDRREPAVYVAIDDQSYIGPTTEVGRTVFGVILTDRGPDRRIVEITNRMKYQKLFGVPNIRKCSQTHYMLDKALEYTGKILVCRVTPEDACLANVVIKDTSAVEATTVTGDFTFTLNSMSVTCAPELVEQVFVGDYIFSSDDTESNALKVISTSRILGTITLKSAYLGTSGVSNLKKDARVTIDGDYTFIDNSSLSEGDDYFGYDIIECSSEDKSLLTVGSWVYLSTDSIDHARQITSLTLDASGNDIVELDAHYTGVHTTGDIKVFLPFTTTSQQNILGVDNIVSGAFVYHFYANGTGTFYNDIVIRGMRNYELEKMYVDDDGVPYYENVFMDIYVYKNNENGTQTLLEGPWAVSITRKTPNDEIIKDFISGTAIYIEDVINANSDYIRVVSGTDVEGLTDRDTGAQKRLQLMTEMLNENPVAMNNVTRGGINFSEGTNGTGMYNSTGILSPDDKLFGRVALAYNGGLLSVDGSIEMMPEQIFPLYEPDYVVSGGFPPIVQLAAANLCNTREDCIQLGDTGTNYNSSNSDLNARRTICSWNMWTSALYVQFRQIRDVYTGMQFFMSPVYHAIQVHLNCDNKYFLGEPACNIEKGAINDEIKLAYQTNHTTRGDLQDKELNYTITETDGVYFSTQFTTWKRFSALKRLHIAKFSAYLHRQIPKILKDVVQRKATAYWLSQAQFRVDNFLLKFMEGAATDRYACINAKTVNIDFDKTRSELNVYVSFTPILSIERINVFLTIPFNL